MSALILPMRKPPGDLMRGQSPGGQAWVGRGITPAKCIERLVSAGAIVADCEVDVFSKREHHFGSARQMRARSHIPSYDCGKPPALISRARIAGIWVGACRLESMAAAARPPILVVSQALALIYLCTVATGQRQRLRSAEDGRSHTYQSSDRGRLVDGFDRHPWRAP